MPCHGCFESHHSAGGFAALGRKHYAPDLRLEPKHIETKLQVDIANERVLADVTTSLVANNSASSIVLNGVDFHDVAVADLSGAEIETSYDGKTIQVYWKKPVAAGETRQLRVTYVVDHPVTGILFSHPNAQYPDRPSFAITDHETERARYWLACVDYPTVRTTFDFHLIAPKNLTLVANGMLQSESVDESTGLKTAHWRLDYPCPSYLVCFAVGDLIRVDHGDVHGIPIAYFAPNGTNPADLLRTFDKTPSILSFLESKLGLPFPFPKYFQIMFPGKGGAMENISFVTWDSAFLMDDNTSLDEWKLITDSVNLHEATHSYFGDAVVIRHFEHAWLKESWATFMEAVWMEDTLGADEGRNELMDQANRYFSETESYVRPIVTREYDSSWHLFDRHLYPGGSWRLNMLRHKLGEQVFWTGVRNYVRKYSRDVAETDDFRKELEKASGLNLTKFFDQFFYGKGFPKLKGEFKYSPENKQVRVSLEQTQMDPKQNIGSFSFDIEVEVACEPVDGVEQPPTLVVLSFDENSRATQVVSVPSKPRLVRIDPVGKVLFTLNEMSGLGDDLLNNAMVGAQDIFNRTWAAKQLIKGGSRSGLKKVDEAMMKEPFWGVRNMVADALGSAKTTAAIQVLVNMLGREADPRCFASIVIACKNLRDPAVREALIAFLSRENLPHRAHARALEALGTMRNPSDFDLILSHLSADTRSPLALVRSGGIRALGLLRGERSFQALMEMLPYGVERYDMRPVVIEALAECARHLSAHKQEAAADALSDVLRDSDILVRKAAIAGLYALQAKQKIGDIECAKPTVPEQDWASVDRRIETLRKVGEEPEARKLWKEVDTLQTKIRKMESQIQDMQAALDEKKA